MEAKRTFLAISLCVLVIVAWNFLTPVINPPPPKPAVPTAANATGQAAPQNAVPVAPSDVPDAILADDSGATAAVMEAPADFGETITVDTPLIKAEVSPRGGVIKELLLNKYNATLGSEAKVALINSKLGITSCLGVYINGQAAWAEDSWTSSTIESASINGTETATLTFSGTFQGLNLTRELTFSADSYIIKEKLFVQNPGAAAVGVKVSYALGTPRLSLADEKYNVTKMAYLTSGNSLHTESDVKDLTNEGMKNPESRWGSVQNNYFLAAIVPSSEDALFLGRIQDNIYRIRLEENQTVINPSATLEYNVAYYMGPKEYDYLSVAPGNLIKSMDYGWFGFISEPLIWFVNLLYSFVGNYGVAIILMTVVIKILFWPLSQKSYKSMERMRKIQPFIKQLQEKYKDNKQEMQREMMRLYKAYKVNPAGGCLPILIQIPVFIGLYQGLINAVELRHASFITYLPFTDKFWLADLSAADPYYITPIVMGASMFLQQKMSPAPGDPMQAKMMMFMPVIFTVLFINFPSGLVLYWLVNNLISIGQQWFTKRKTEKAQQKAEAGKAEK